HDRGQNRELGVERVLNTNDRVTTEPKRIGKEKGSLQTSDVIAKQSRGNTADNNNSKITPIAYRKGRSVLDENAVTNQTAAHSAHQRQHEQADHVIVPANRKQGAGHRVEACRT